MVAAAAAELDTLVAVEVLAVEMPKVLVVEARPGRVHLA
jgi:hypothetical protein